MVLARLVVGLGGCGVVCAVYPWLPETIWWAASPAVCMLQPSACMAAPTGHRIQDGFRVAAGAVECTRCTHFAL